MKKICHIVGARPNFVKAAPLVNALQTFRVEQLLIHTGQHYDPALSKVFFEELQLPPASIQLELSSQTTAEKLGEITQKLSRILHELQPILVIVYGDVYSSLAGALAANSLQIPIAHVEAGLRSFDWSMPEERNRVLIDRLAQFLFLTEKNAVFNLKQEGIATNRAYFVGNTMIDSLQNKLDAAQALKQWQNYQLQPKNYGLLTLHRPSNVDELLQLEQILQKIDQLSEGMPILFPVHPRTQQQLNQSVLQLQHIRCITPLPYLAFISLLKAAQLILTDSGGIQEESSYLAVNCLTLRKNTERPITLELGTNILVPELDSLPKLWKSTTKKEAKQISIPLWDGKAAIRIANILSDVLQLDKK